VRKETLSRARQSIFTRVIRAHVTTRREEHRPESDPCTKLHNATLIGKGIEPEHRTIKFTLPRCTAEWSAIIRRTIQVPRLKLIRALWWRQESESRRHPALSNFGCLSSRGRGWSWRERNADGWLRTFGTSAKALF